MAAPGTVKPVVLLKTTGDLSDGEFRATFSLLSHVLKLMRMLYSGIDAQSIHTVAVELSGQVQRCHQVIDSSPALQLSLQEQQALLDRLVEQLHERSLLLNSYRQLELFRN